MGVGCLIEFVGPFSGMIVGWPDGLGCSTASVTGVSLAVGFGGVLSDLYVLATLLERTPEMSGTLVLQWLTRDSTLLSVAILTSLAGGLTWFVLTQWLAALTAARNEVLGLHLNNNRIQGGKP